ncbi:gliding motility-associated C-terminal domain-containing protein, partial [Pedobacter sp. SYSU D00535]|uniref:T9SS type B sorting domain-containing protein n=1 Tax=Pedobacter sp. SYSU D00535 TaxID=2810308 RepID=UPI001A9762CE
NVTVEGASTGAIDITVTGGTSPYTYSWSNGATTEDLTGLAAGTYMVTVTDKNNITATTSATITEPSGALAATVTSKTDVFVKGASTGAIDITVAGGTAPYTYAWSNGATTEDLTGLAAGTYTVTVSDKNGITATTSATITEPSGLLAATVTSKTDVAVKGASTGAIDITVTGGTAPYTYAWSNGATTEDLTGLAAGTYTVTVSDKNGITATTAATITEPSALLAVSVTSKTDVFVKGASTGAVDITVTGGTAPYTYSWSNGATTEDLTGVSAGTYTVTVTDKNGVATTASATITEPSALLAAVVTSKTDVTVKGASTGAVDITVTGGTSPYTYSWSNGATTEDVTGVPAGTYTLTVTDKNGVSTTASATITEPSALLAATVTSKTDVTVKGASTGAIDITVTGGTSPYTYSWSNGATTEDLTGVSVGTYTVTVTDKNGVSTTASATITEPSALLAVTVTSKNDVTIKGASTGAVTITGSGGTGPYEYKIGTGTYQSNGTFTGLPAGTYILAVKDANGITESTSVTIGEPAAALALVITAKTDITVKGTSTGSLTVSASGGTAPYEYKIENGAYQSSATFSNLAAGTYTITAKDANGVTKTTTATIAEPGANLTVAVTSKTDITAFGGSTGAVTVAGSGGTGPYEYKIGTGAYQSSGSFTGLPAGTYTVSIKDANGVIATTTVVITQPSAALSLVVASKSNVTVHNGANGSVSLTAAGGTGPYEYKLGNGNFQSSASFNGLVSGTYTATVRDVNGLLASVNFTIEQPQQLTIALDYKKDISGGDLSSGAIKVKGAGGTGPYTYKLGDGPYGSSDTFENLKPGKYTITIKDAQGVTQTIEVTIDGASIANVFTPNGDGKNDAFVIAGLENYDRAELTIFNRWGSEVYRNNNYNNTWEGSGLNTGTYYYIIKLKKGNNEDIRKGWVLLKR